MATIRIVRPVGTDAGAGIAAGLNSLATAFDPTAQARGVALAQQGRYAQVRADTDQYQLDQLRASQDLIRNGGTTNAPLSAALVGAAGPGAHNFTHMPQFQLMLTSQTPGATQADIDRAALGAGQSFQNTAAGRTQAEAAAADRSRIAAGPGYARVAEERRQFDQTPVTAFTGPEGTPVFVPRARLSATGEDGAPVYRPPVTMGQVQGQVAQTAVRPGAAEIVPGVSNLATVLAPGTAVGVIRDDQRAVTWRMPDGSTASGSEGSMPEGATLLGRTAGPTGRGPNPLTVPTGPGFANAIDAAVRARINVSPTPELMQQLQQEIAPLFQNGEFRGNLAGAIDAVLDRYQPQGVGNPFSRNTLVPRAAYSAPVASAAAGPRPNAAPAPTTPAPAAPARQPTTSDLPRIADDAGFAALPRGARFIDPEGNVRRKP